jgi:hypothetical protein
VAHGRFCRRKPSGALQLEADLGGTAGRNPATSAASGGLSAGSLTATRQCHRHRIHRMLRQGAWLILLRNLASSVRVLPPQPKCKRAPFRGPFAFLPRAEVHWNRTLQFPPVALCQPNIVAVEKLSLRRAGLWSPAAVRARGPGPKRHPRRVVRGHTSRCTWSLYLGWDLGDALRRWRGAAARARCCCVSLCSSFGQVSRRRRSANVSRHTLTEHARGHVQGRHCITRLSRIARRTVTACRRCAEGFLTNRPPKPQTIDSGGHSVISASWRNV